LPSGLPNRRSNGPRRNSSHYGEVCYIARDNGICADHGVNPNSDTWSDHCTDTYKAAAPYGDRSTEERRLNGNRHTWVAWMLLIPDPNPIGNQHIIFEHYRIERTYLHKASDQTPIAYPKARSIVGSPLRVEANVIRHPAVVTDRKVSRIRCMETQPKTRAPANVREIAAGQDHVH
jgi:hypothetical protein